MHTLLDYITGMGFVGTEPGKLYDLAPVTRGAETTLSGTGTVVLEDAVGDWVELSLYGRSEQTTTTGAQLFDYSTILSKQITAGVVHIDADGRIILDGKFGAGSREFRITLLPGTYTLSADDPEKWHILAPADSLFNQTLQVDEITTYECYIASGTYDRIATTPMINQGSKALPWEPYTGGQPSPNPDYPQEIVSVGDDGEIGVNVYGGNLLHLPDGNMGKYISISNDIITINSGARGRSNFMQIPEMVFNPNKYTMSIVPLDNIENDGTFQFAFRISVRDKVNDYVVSSTGWYMGGVVQGTNGQDTIEITDKITAKYFNVDIVKGDFTGQRFKIILNIGSTALPYEPYKQPQSLIVSTPNGLPGIPVSSGGNYTDENGQQWISDEIDFKRGKYVKRVAWVTFDGSEDELFIKSQAYGLWRYGIEIIDMLAIPENNTNGLCTQYIGEENPDLPGKFYMWNKNIFLFPIEEFDTAEQFKVSLQENPVLVYYVLSTPIETDLAQEEIEVYKALLTYKPTTIITADGGEVAPGIAATYKKGE